jgi:hypothetical protein
MTEQAVYGWLITVDTADGAPSKVYNVAIPEERLAVEAVRHIVPSKAIVKVKSKLTKQLCDALKMKAGDVMLGARKRRPGDDVS